MEEKKLLLDEMKRLNRRNDLLEKEINISTEDKVESEERIIRNALAMCEIANTLKRFC